MPRPKVERCAWWAVGFDIKRSACGVVWSAIKDTPAECCKCGKPVNLVKEEPR